jgi:hypothetical protein
MEGLLGDKTPPHPSKTRCRKASSDTRQKRLARRRSLLLFGLLFLTSWGQVRSDDKIGQSGEDRLTFCIYEAWSSEGVA